MGEPGLLTNYINILYEKTFKISPGTLHPGFALFGAVHLLWASYSFCYTAQRLFCRTWNTCIVTAATGVRIQEFYALLWLLECSERRTRTDDLRVMSPVSYQLLYLAI